MSSRFPKRDFPHPFPRFRRELDERIQAFKLAHGRDPVRIMMHRRMEGNAKAGSYGECDFSNGRPDTVYGLEAVWDCDEFDLA